MTTLRGLAGALVPFAASFALHIVGGATDQGWLFVLAVVLIYLTAAGLPAIAHLLSGQPARSRATWLIGGAIGIVLTASALRAANDRTFEWWMAPLAVGLVVLTSAAIIGLARARRAFATRQPA